MASPPWVGVFGTAGVFVRPSRDCSTKWINPSLFRNLQLDRIPWDGQHAGESLVSKTLPSPLKPGSGERPPSARPACQHLPSRGAKNKSLSHSKTMKEKPQRPKAPLSHSPGPLRRDIPPKLAATCGLSLTAEWCLDLWHGTGWHGTARHSTTCPGQPHGRSVCAGFNSWREHEWG